MSPQHTTSASEGEGAFDDSDARSAFELDEPSYPSPNSKELEEALLTVPKPSLTSTTTSGGGGGVHTSPLSRSSAHQGQVHDQSSPGSAHSTSPSRRVVELPASPTRTPRSQRSDKISPRARRADSLGHTKASSMLQLGRPTKAASTPRSTRTTSIEGDSMVVHDDLVDGGVGLDSHLAPDWSTEGWGYDAERVARRAKIESSKQVELRATMLDQERRELPTLPTWGLLSENAQRTK